MIKHEFYELTWVKYTEELCSQVLTNDKKNDG